MRRLFIIALVTSLVLSVAVAANAAPNPEKKFDRLPTPERVTAEHIDALNNCDVDRLMAQYPQSVHIVLPGGVTVEGRDAVRDLFEGFCLPFEQGGLNGLQFTEVDSWRVHKTINMQWVANADFLCEPYYGADAYETWAGLMAAQVTTFDGAELETVDENGECPTTYYTTAGPMGEDEVGNILAHQHMFVEFQVAPPVAYLDSTPQEVWAEIGDMVLEAKNLGYSVFIEPTPLGVGRRPDIVDYVADKAGLPTMMPTGIYHEPYVPDWVYDATVDELTDWMLEELNVGVGDTDVQAGFIKLADNWDGIHEVEMKVLEAACNASRETDAAIASHILSSWTADAVLDALEGFGCSPDRFVWIHAPYTAFSEDVEGGTVGTDALMAAAGRGAYLSLDFIGSQFWVGWVGDNSDERHFALLDALVNAGYEDQLLIGSDTGWFDPGNPDFLIEPYDQIMTSFVPFLRDQGYSEGLIGKFLHDNPWEAYSR
jgi:phosphotriesterase-related protein